MVGSALQAKFSGPYAIDRKLSETDYVIQTPDCKKKTCVCQINMLKACTDREDSVHSAPVAPVVSVAAASPYDPGNDGLDD